jgi:hypothetical protein
MIQTGKLVVNLDVRVVSVDDKPVRLTGKEYGVLELLCLRKGSIVTKEMLLSFRWLCQSRISAIDRDRGTPRGGKARCSLTGAVAVGWRRPPSQSKSHNRVKLAVLKFLLKSGVVKEN